MVNEKVNKRIKIKRNYRDRNFQKGERIFDTFIYLIIALGILIVVLPLMYILANSFSDPELVYFGKVMFLPRGFTLEGYAKVFRNSKIMIGYGNTILYTLIGCTISMCLIFCAAYPLSRRNLPGHKFLNIFFVLTMYVSGGMIPTYIVVNSLGLVDTIWGFVLPMSMGVYNIIVVRSYIQSTIPEDIIQAAKIDGANDFRVFLSIILPLCGPIMAVMLLFTLVGYWNAYFPALLYLRDANKQPLQMVLRDILLLSSMVDESTDPEEAMNNLLLGAVLRYSTIVAAIVPMMVLYPFLQKYFEKGMMIGSLKG